MNHADNPAARGMRRGVKVAGDKCYDDGCHHRHKSQKELYYHEDRTHLGLGKGTPEGRTRTVAAGHVLSHRRLGGLHHRYDRAA